MDIAQCPDFSLYEHAAKVAEAIARVHRTEAALIGVPAGPRRDLLLDARERAWQHQDEVELAQNAALRAQERATLAATVVDGLLSLEAALG